MMTSQRLLFGLVLILTLTISATSLRSQEKDSDGTQELLDGKILQRLDAILGADDAPRQHQDELWKASAVTHGSVEPLLAVLTARIDAKQTPKAQRQRALRLSARLLRRLGDTGRALAMLERIDLDQQSPADCLSIAEVLDALGRNERALEAYDRLLKLPISTEQRNVVLLRKALMTKVEKKKKVEEGKETESSPLAKFAAESDRAPKQRNQAAVVLALQNEQKDAIKVFKVSGEGTRRYRQEVRIAEWAIEAEQWKEAQDFAWKAVKTAKLRRDRRYALTILVEAYRRADSLEQLIERLAADAALDDESRQVWIDLLRETGKVTDALKLFRESVDGEFTIDMRRELLEMCRETGQEKVLVEAYGKLIKEEPRFIEWREGLSRFYLERGDRETAVNVWSNYLETTESIRYRMAAAGVLMNLGLDDLAIRFARACMTTDQARNNSCLFLFELHLDRGRRAEAEEMLAELGRTAPPASGIRKDMADAWARLGKKKKAVEELQTFHAALKPDASPDSRMKLAILLSDVGEEEKALELWQSLMRQVDSIPRRRYVEERVMTVAARLGTLARIAVSLEKKLAAGKADNLDAALLVRLYTRVKDSVSATEVIEEHMSRSGAKQANVLAEKARVFLTCQDYYNYEKALRQLMEVDPEGRPDYLRQLAMSNLERGQRKEAREILEQLKHVDGDVVSDEFEAGVLALAGMREEASQVYRRAVARHPERIDTYLLLSNVQKELGRHDRSAGMFQYLAATAEKDDLFTIAIDGILNMRDGRSNRGAPDRLVKWARRITLERVARRPDKFYLYQLVADLSEELKDRGMAIRALKAALPIAGEQRTTLLRELMTMAKGRSRNSGLIRFGPGSSRQIKDKVNHQQLLFGRRLLGQGELVPPQVYLELGSAFLDAGEVSNANKTFNLASQLPEFAELQPRIAHAFEAAGYPDEALRIYARILTIQTSDVGLMVRVAELHEQLGRDALSLELYTRCLDLLLDRSPLPTTTARKRKDDVDQRFSSMQGSRNTDPFEQHYPWVLQGLLATLPGGAEIDRFLDKLEAEVEKDMAEVAKLVSSDLSTLGHFPRLDRRAALLRRLAAACQRIGRADAVDARLLAQLENDEDLLEYLVRFRLRWGHVVSARQLIKESGRPAKQIRRLQLLAGGGNADDLPGRISAAEATGLLLPLLVDGRNAAAKTLLERLDLSASDKGDVERMPILVSVATYLGESEIALSLCRHWLTLLTTLDVRSLYGPVEALLSQSRIVLDSEQLRSLFEDLVNRVIEKPDKFSVFIRRLPDLQKSIGASLVTSQQVEKLIKSRLEASDRFIYGIPELFALLDQKERAPVLRALWSKVPKTQRAFFLIRLLPTLDEKVDEGFAEFLVGQFKKGVKETDDKRMLTYYVDEMLASGAKNGEVILGFLDAALAEDKESPVFSSARAVTLKRLGREAEAVATAVAMFKSSLDVPKGPQDYYVNQAFRSITDEFKDEHLDKLLAVIDEYEAKNGADVRLARKRLDLIGSLNDPQALEVALRKAAQAHPTESSLQSRLQRFLRGRHALLEATRVQEVMVELKPKDLSTRSRLVGLWQQLRNDVQALAVYEAGKEEKTEKKPDKGGVRKTRTPRPTVSGIKQALDGKESEAARRMFRRIWRVFPDRSQQYYEHAWRNAQTRVHYWPRIPPPPETTAEAEKRKKAKRHRGGLPSSYTELPKPENPALKAKQRNLNQRVSLPEKIASESFGKQELARQLRSLEHFQLDEPLASHILQALTKREVEELGREQAVERLLAAEKVGTAGKIDYGRLFVLLEELPARSVSSDTLAGLVKNQKPSDVGQLRRLARMYAKSGQGAKASVLYRWSAVLKSGGRGSFYNLAADLLKEVLEHLKGEERDRAIEDILAFGRPGPETYYGHDQYERLVIETWEKVIGPDKTLQKAAVVLASVTELGTMPKRRACMAATWILARGGKIERALECLEVAICKLPVPPVLKYPWYRQNFENPGYLSQQDIQRILPLDTKGWPDPSSWLNALSARIGTWVEANRLRESNAFQLLSVLALRLHATQQHEQALATLDRVDKLAKGHPGQLLWVADVARRLGEGARADQIERTLFDQRRLHVERIPEVVARLIEREGPEAGIALGEKAAEYTLHPDLLDHLAFAATATGNTERADHWTALKKQAAAARETLIAERKRESERNKANSSSRAIRIRTP